MSAAVVLVALVLTAAAVWVRGRLAAAEAGRVELEAWRLSLGLPADRFRVVDSGLVDAWRTCRTVPAFCTVQATVRPAPAELGEVAG